MHWFQSWAADNCRMAGLGHSDGEALVDARGNELNEQDLSLPNVQPQPLDIPTVEKLAPVGDMNHPPPEPGAHAGSRASL
ncbi:hypothetical protein [Massilia sp. Mn16-1_5]|uniref:hypothetical protein n=1 Tax=Massilia sp. Mn16-1_5 TaxID=2079199 RepID=UPI00109ECC78|nr:hypothetical protein [Massilia sp. Mn16-1_5]